MSEIQFGVVVIPQGCSYDLPKAAKMVDTQQQQVQEQQIENQQASMQYEFSKSISQAVDDSSGFDSIYTYDHFYHTMHQITRMISLSVLHYYHQLQK